MKKMKILLTSLILAALASSLVILSPVGLAEEEKQYRKGIVASIGSKDYLIAGNNQFVEILEITPDNKLFPVSEVHGMARVNDLCFSSEQSKDYLIVADGQYLIKYDITNPVLPEAVFQKDLYEWRGKGKRKIGYMSILACNDGYIFTGGKRGVRKFAKETLVPDDNKFYTLEEVYGLAVSNEKLAVIIKNSVFGENRGPSQGLIFNISSGELEKEVKLENIDNIKRTPAIDSAGNVYFPSDNSLIKVDSAGNVAGQYYNEGVEEGVTHSYAVFALSPNEIFYANGFGVAKLNDRLSKKDFFFSANSYLYGPNSWAVGVGAGETSQGVRVAIFNKSSLLLLDDNLDLLFQPQYAPLYTDQSGESISTELKITLSRYFGLSSGDSVEAEVFGFWPNEEVEIKLGDTEYIIKVNNVGYRKTLISILEMERGMTVISAIGRNSGLAYQVSFEIK